MVELEWEADRRNDATFVAATVTNTRTTPQSVRVESRLDGPTWPHRRNGVTAPEWDEDGWTATIEPGRCRGIGFASSGEATAPPLEVVTVERASSPRQPSPERTLSELDAWSPTTDVLPRDL